MGNERFDVARKIKRMTRKELKETDQVMTRLQVLYEWLGKNRTYLIVGVVGLVVLLFAFSGIVTWLSSRSQAVAGEFEKAFAPVQAVVVAPDEEPDLPGRRGLVPRETYPTKDARWKAAEERLTAFLEAHGGSTVGNTAMLSLAGVRADQRDWDQAAAGMRAFLEAEPESPASPLVIESLGLLAAQQGKRQEAATWFRKLVASPFPHFQALGHDHLGDLANPGFGGDDAAAAEKAYRAAIAILRTGEGEKRAPAVADSRLRDELERKLALVEIGR